MSITGFPQSRKERIDLLSKRNRNVPIVSSIEMSPQWEEEGLWELWKTVL